MSSRETLRSIVGSAVAGAIAVVCAKSGGSVWISVALGAACGMLFDAVCRLLMKQ